MGVAAGLLILLLAAFNVKAACKAGLPGRVHGESAIKCGVASFQMAKVRIFRDIVERFYPLFRYPFIFFPYS